MNFTGTRTASGFGKRINWHLVTLASGITLVASIALTGGAFERSGGGGDVAVPQPVAAIDIGSEITGTESSAQTILYIVGSEAQGLALQQQASQAGHEAPGVDRFVLVADSAADEAAVLAAIGESMQLPNFGVVDLR